MNFRPNQKVVCIDADPVDGKFPIEIKKGEVYTIETISSFCCIPVVVTLKEVVCGPHRIINQTCRHCGKETLMDIILYSARRFAPLEDKSAESELFSEDLIKQLEEEINEENLVYIMDHSMDAKNYLIPRYGSKWDLDDLPGIR